MAIKITKLDGPTPEGQVINDVEIHGPTYTPNVGYLLWLLENNGAIEDDEGIERPICTYITEEIRIFTFQLRGVVFIYKVEISDE